MNDSRAIAILVAGGRGLRAGGSGPKQWLPLAGRRVADWALRAFAAHPAVSAVVVVHHADDLAQASDLNGPITLTTGGATRAESVQNGLQAAAALSPDIVLIHDMARPCVPADLISACITAARDTGGAAPAIPLSDALWRGAQGQVLGSQPRDGLYRAQTPQCFDYHKLVAAHAMADPDAADDVAVAQAAGMTVAIVPGSEDNIKITYPEDFARAERIMGQAMRLRVGNGYDVHKFGPGSAVILCGRPIPHSAALMGHSDADVAMHAVTDALYGALADGDIGQHFPPSDPEWKGAASDIFLKHAVARVAAAGFEIANVDCTIVCEYPKIGPHAQAMRENMADLMGMDMEQVSVKATTSEKLGFTGREEGIASIATVALVGVGQ